MRSTLTLLALTILAACSGEVALTPTSTHGTGGASSTGSATSGSGGSGGAVNPTAITGTFLNTYVTDTGDVVLPQDPTAVTLSAMVQRSDGGWDTYPGTLDASGHFVIPGVPLGPAYVIARLPGNPQASNVWHTAERTLDLGAKTGGRPDIAWTTQPTPLTLKIAGADDWDLQSSQIEFTSRGAGFLDRASCSGGLAGCFNQPVNTRPLADAAKGDHTWLLHLSCDPTGLTCALTDAVESSTFTMQDGVPATFTGTAAPVPQAHATLVYDANALAEAAEVGAGNTSGGVAVALSEQPLWHMGRLLGKTSWPGVGTGTFDLRYGALPPDGAPPSLYFAYSSAGQAVMIFASLPAAAQNTLRPQVSVPRNVLIDGQPAEAGPIGVGASPTVAWTAPALGKPDGYVLWVGPASPSALPHVQLHTKETQLTLPPGILTPGTYRVDVDSLLTDAQTGIETTASTYGGTFTP